LSDRLSDEGFEYYARILFKGCFRPSRLGSGIYLPPPQPEDLLEFRPFLDEMRPPINQDEKAKDLILLNIPDWKVAVNFSPRNLNKIGFARRFVWALMSSWLPVIKGQWSMPGRIGLSTG
jgi:hypothetical protein